MIWKTIGQSVTGTSHVAAEKGCEDAIQYRVVHDANDDEVLVCCVSDGAGSAQFAAWASDYATTKVAQTLSGLEINTAEISTGDIYSIVEEVYDTFCIEAEVYQVELNEYSCTLLGCCITKARAVFFQVGDGAIVRNDGSGFFTPVWMPHNGEYQNSTSFIVDDKTLANLHISILDEKVDEVALFTDGLQLLALNMEAETVHQPFFNDLFRFLRMANEPDNVAVLNRKLAEYLESPQINERTDDDKTLFLASRLTS